MLTAGLLFHLITVLLLFLGKNAAHVSDVHLNLANRVRHHLYRKLQTKAGILAPWAN